MRRTAIAIGASGEVVVNLQQMLVAQGYAIPDAELKRKLFGPGTELALRQWQRDHGQEPTGMLTEIGAPALGIDLTLPGEGGFHPPTDGEVPPEFEFLVRGQVIYRAGLPIEGVTVRAVHKELRREIPLGAATTDATGRFEIYYSNDKLPRPEQGVDLLVRAYRKINRRQEEVIADWPVIFGARRVEKVRLKVDGGPEKTWSEYEQAMTELEPLLEGVPLADLVESDKQTDISLLSGKTSQLPKRIADLVVAHKLAAATGGDPEVYYGLIRADLPTNANQLLSQSPGVQKLALKEAIDRHVAPGRLLDRLDKIDKELGAAAIRAAAAKEGPGGAPTIGSFLATVLPDEGARTTFLTRYAEHRGPIAEFWQALEADPDFKDQVPALQFTLQATALTGRQLPLVEVLQQRRDAGDLGSLRQLARLSVDDWKNLIASQQVAEDQRVPPAIPGEKPEERVQLYAETLHRVIADLVPTDVVAYRIQADDRQPEGLRTFWKNVTERQAPLDLRNARVDELLTQQPELLEGIPEDQQPAVRAELATTRRLFNLTTRYEALDALKQGGVDSAQAAARLGQGVFVQRFAEPLGGEAAALVAYEKATTVAGSSVAVFANYAPEFNEVVPRVLLQPTPKEVPNLRTLFGSLDLCACGHCRSVHGPAAYLADLFAFLRDRELQIPVGGGATIASTMLAQLLDRRPDLGEIELTCANTETPLPYVDLVNELLENVVAPPQPFDLPAGVAADLDARNLSAAIRNAFVAEGITLSTDHYIVPVTPGDRWFITDHSTLYPIARSNGAIEAGVVAYQTNGTPRELAANPEHINPDAYQVLRGAVFPANLPLDLWWEEARVYLGQLGIDRDALMTTLWPGNPSDAPADLTILTERLGLTTVERELILGGLPVRLATTGAAGALSGTPNVDGVATAAGDLVIVKDQANPADNGLYRVAAGGWTRAAPATETHFVAVTGGASNAGSTWLIGPGPNGDPVGRRLAPWDFWGLREHNNQVEIFDPANPDGPTVASLDWLPALSWVPQMRARAGLTYPELIDLLSTRFINPSTVPATRLRIDSADPNDAATCELWKLRIVNLDAAAASRIRRFTRLQRSLGWTARELDEAIMALGSGIADVNARLTEQLLAVLAQIERLRGVLDLPIEQLLTFWTPLPTYNPIPIDQVPPRPRGGEALYHRLFRNPAVISPLDDAFRLDAAGELAIVAADPASATIAAHLPGVLAGIGATAAEIELLTPLAAPGGALDLANLSSLYRHVRLARGLDLPVADLVALREMSGLDPFDPAHPETTAQFVALVDNVRASGFTVAEIDELLFHRLLGASGLTPADPVLAQTLDDLRTGLRAIQEQTALQPDPTGDLTRATLATLRWPADVIDKVIRALDGTNTANPQAVLTRWLRAMTWPTLREPLTALPAGVVFPADLRRRVFYDAPAQELAFVGMMGEADKTRLDALSNDPAYRTAVQALFDRTANDEPPADQALLNPADRPADAAALLALATPELRFAELLGRLLAYLRRTGYVRLVTQRLAEVLGVPVRTADRLLQGQIKAITDPTRPAIADFLVSAYAESDPNVPITRDGFPAQMQTLARVHKVAILASRLRWTVVQLDWLNDFGPTVPARPVAWRTAAPLAVSWLDLNDLPATEEARDPARFAAWLRLVDLAALRSGIPRATETLTDLFTLARAPGVTSGALFDLLSERTGWDRDTVEGAAGPAGLNLTLPDAFLDEPALIRLRDAVRALRRLGVAAATARAWTQPQPGAGDARAIRQAVRARYPDDQWYEIARPLRDKLRERQRQALVAYLVSGAHPTHGLRWKDTNDLYADYLIDVEMDPCMLTSRIKQALSSTQLFTQRCLLSLEDGITTDATPDPGWLEWPWRKNYRVWEANFRIFLYPENWLEPELRDGKSPLFQALENTLLQGEVTKESAEDAFRDYLHGLDTIARLEIVGLYDVPAADGQPRVLHVIGRTRGTPGVFYYRQQVDNGAWTSWERIDLDITEPQVLPIIWNRRFYLFWLVINEVATQTIPTEDKPTPPQRYFDIQIAWSERKGNAWQPKKVTRQVIRSLVRPDDTLADHGKGLHALRAAIVGAGLKIWYEYDNAGTISAPPPPTGTGQEPPVEPFTTTQGFHFTGCDGQVELFSIDIGGIFQVPGTAVDGMLFREDGSKPLLLPKGASESGDDAALASTPGIFSIAYAHQDGYLTGRRSFFFQDQEKTYMVVPSEETVSERHWDDPVVVDPSIIDLVDKYYYEPNWIDPLGPVEHIEDVINPRGPLERTFAIDPQMPLERVANPVPVERYLLSAARAAAPPVAETHLLSATVAAPAAANGGHPAIAADGNGTARRALHANFLTLTGTLPTTDPGLTLLNTRATTSLSGAMAALGEARASVKVRRDQQPKMVVAKGDHALLDVGAYIDTERVVSKLGWTIVSKRVNRYRFYPYQHPYVCDFLKELNRVGLEGLLRRETQLLISRPFKGRYSPTGLVVKGTATATVAEPLYPVEDVDFTYDGAYSLYNWELFFHAPLLIATSLSRNQRFAEARDWFHAMFDPTDATDPAVASNGNGFAPRRFWRTRPFWEESQADYLNARIDRLLAMLAAGSTDPELQRQVTEWTRNPFKPHAIARLRIPAYQKQVVMRYLDNLIAWGDQLFRRDTIETINEATQLYILAAEILGPRPDIVPARAEPRVQTGNTLEPSLSQLSNKLVEIEQLFTAPQPDSVVVDPTTPPLPLPKLLYFCVPPNDKLLGYWDTVADRLFKIRHCMNIEGVVRSLALFEPPIDPALLVRAAAAGVDLSSVLSESAAPMPHYRFRTLAAKAADLVREVKELGQGLLAALEKRDAETLAQLRASQEVALLDLVEEVRRQQVLEQTRQIDALQALRKLSEVRYLHYQRLLGIQDARIPGEGEAPATDPEPSAEASILEEAGAKMIQREKTELAKLKEATDKQQTAIGWELGANASYYIPTFATQITPWGVGIKIEFGGQHVGPALRAIADWFKTESAGATFDSSSAGRIGSFILRAHEWLLQSKLAAREIGQTDAQIATARIREGIAVKELENHLEQIAQAKAVEETLRTKFTNQELYTWMIGQVSATYFQAYQLAYDVAKRAERAFRFELGLTDSNYVQFGYWDSLKKGLLAGERLAYDLHRLDVAYFENNKREYEVTKHVSLASLHPAALVSLRESGSCMVELPEEIFDLDYPGHYMRRLKSVGLSIPCTTGPYTSVSCTLTLLGNRVRMNARTDPTYPFQGVDDPRFTVNSGGIQSIVTSSGREDSGLFEVSLQDERYLPFEGTGAVSAWRIELPPDFRQFDYTTISDVILHLRYTARDGGTPLRTSAVSSLTNTLKTMEIEEGTNGLFRLFSGARDYPDAWQAFLFRPEGAAGAAELALTLDPRRFPAYLQDRTLKMADLTVLLKVAPGVEYDEGDPLILDVTAPGGAAQQVTLTPVETDLGGLPAGQVDYSAAPVTLTAAQPWRVAVNTLPAVLTEEIEVEGAIVQRLDPAKVSDLALLCHYTY